MRPDRHGRHQRRPADPRRRPTDGFRTLRRGRFDRLVGKAVDDLPAGLLGYLDNVEITVEEVPPTDLLTESGILLGLYQGVPLTERGDGSMLLPDRITLFRRPLEARASTREELAELVRETVVHEIAHHFGIDDDRLDDLGWG